MQNITFKTEDNLIADYDVQLKNKTITIKINNNTISPNNLQRIGIENFNKALISRGIIQSNMKLTDFILVFDDGKPVSLGENDL